MWRRELITKNDKTDHMVPANIFVYISHKSPSLPIETLTKMLHIKALSKFLILYIKIILRLCSIKNSLLFFFLFDFCFEKIMLILLKSILTSMGPRRKKNHFPGCNLRFLLIGC